MIYAILGLSAGFIFLVVLIAILLIKSSLHTGYKFLVVVFGIAFFWIQYLSLIQYGGWPIKAQLPDEFILIASEVREPNAQIGEEGVMYWWVQESADRSIPPRIYELPYQLQLHEKGEEVVEQQKQGTQYVGRTTTSSSSSDSKGLGVSFERIKKSERHKKN